MRIDINAARAELAQLERSHRYGGGTDVVAFAARLLDEIARLTDSEDSRVVVLEAENKRLRDELGDEVVITAEGLGEAMDRMRQLRLPGQRDGEVGS